MVEKLPQKQYYLALYGIWILDFFRNFNMNICLNISSLAIVSLVLVFFH